MASLLWTVLLICVAAPYASGVVAVGGDCSGGDACDADLVCDAGTCKLKVDGDCTAPNDDKCATGSTCDTQLNQCTCTPPLVTDQATKVCKPASVSQPQTPAAGALGGDCRSSGVACDPAATSICDTDTKCKLKAGGDCSGANADKCPTGTTCDTQSQPNKCACTAAGNVVDPGTGLCKQGSSVVGQPQTPVAGALGGACKSDGSCTDATSVCDTDTKCKLKAGGDCKAPNADKCLTGTTCKTDKCECATHKFANQTSGLCIDVPAGKVGYPCTAAKKDTDCPSDKHLKCDDGKKECICDTGFSGSRGGDCSSGSAALTSVTSLALVALFWASRHLLKE